MLGISALPSAIQLIGFIFMPESPRWLTRRGKYEKAQKVLRSIHDDSDIEEEFNSIKNALQAQEREQAEKGGTSLFEQILQRATLRKALLVGCTLKMAQQICGINSVL